MLILLGILMEKSLENWVSENFIPTQSILFLYFQGTSKEIPRFCFESRVQNQSFSLNIFNKLKFRMCSPRSFSVKHLIEDESCGPNIALTCICFGFQDLKRHIERCSHRWSIFHPLCHVLLGKAKISDLANPLTEHDIGWLEVPSWMEIYLWTMPSRTSAINPLQICLKNPITSL